MKTRILSSIVALILLICIILSHKIVLTIAVFLLSFVAIHEYYNAMAAGGFKPLKLWGYISCLIIPFIGFDGLELTEGKVIDTTKWLNYIPEIIFISMVVLFFVVIVTNNKYNIVDISITIFGALYVPFLFVFLPMTRNMTDGFVYMWFVFIGAWIPDTFAYFCGVFWGRHKFLPISPKKTIEGSIGGITGAILVTTVYGIVIQKYGYIDGVNLIHFIVLGAICGIISQLGDLAASSIKRFAGIKDYGNLMPGHGGALDRIDSLLFIAPVVYLYFNRIIGI